MRWNCQERSQCWLRHCLADLGRLDYLFPGEQGPGDVDGLMEVGHRFLLMEWKTRREPLPPGQHITFKRLTAKFPDDVHVLVIHGNGATGETWGWCWYEAGAVTEWTDGGEADLHRAIRAWDFTARHKHAEETR